MKLLKTHFHPEINSLENKSIFTREATRAITLRDDDILLMYTERYDDYSLPGGGLDMGENKIQGMIRELQEETGAHTIENILPFGIYEEYRPWYKEDFDIQRMVSYCYTCSISKQLGDNNLESYELKNGMRPIWVNIHEAIEYNLNTIDASPKKGLSIERETFLLQHIAEGISS